MAGAARAVPDLTEHCALCGSQLWWDPRIDHRSASTDEDVADALTFCNCESRTRRGKCGVCSACRIEQHGCACDGAYDAGCFSCTPGEFERPPCPHDASMLGWFGSVQEWVQFIEAGGGGDFRQVAGGGPPPERSIYSDIRGFWVSTSLISGVQHLYCWVPDCIGNRDPDRRYHNSPESSAIWKTGTR